MNSPNPSDQRPTDPITAKDAASLYGAIDSLAKKLETELQSIRATVASIQDKLINILGTQSRIEAGLADSRTNRLEIELKEAEIDRAKAEDSLRKAEERLALKQDVKEKTIDTNEKIKSAAISELQNIERQKEETRKARIEDLKWTVTKAVVTWGAVGLVGLVVTFLWFLIQLFMNRGSP